MPKLTGAKAITKHINRSESTLMGMILRGDFPAQKIKGDWVAESGKVDEYMIKAQGISDALREDEKKKKTSGRKSRKEKK